MPHRNICLYRKMIAFSSICKYFAVSLSLSLMLMSSCSTKNEKKVAISSVNLQAALSNGLKAQGTATSFSHTEYLGLSYSTYQRWKIDIIIINQTHFNLQLGNDLFLVESNPEASTIEGVACFRGQQREQKASFAKETMWNFPYPFSNYERHYTDGGKFVRRGTNVSMTISDNKPRKQTPATNKEPLDFGLLPAAGNLPLNMEMDEGEWIKSDLLASVRIVLPEVSVTTTHGLERFRLTVFCERQNADRGHGK